MGGDINNVALASNSMKFRVPFNVVVLLEVLRDESAELIIRSMVIPCKVTYFISNLVLINNLADKGGLKLASVTANYLWQRQQGLTKDSFCVNKISNNYYKSYTI